jgi:hypothetical protein
MAGRISAAFSKIATCSDAYQEMTRILRKVSTSVAEQFEPPLVVTDIRQ